MCISAVKEISINDADIDEIERLFGDITFDAERRKIIKNLDNIDIQAFPGSGKTTVLIAKLAILAKKWPYDNIGICVLSHTNVAREEIEDRLGQTELGKKLLSYPHFIGTFHSFCDTFISIPWLRSNGYPITLIDTEIALRRRWSRLRYGTRSYLENKGKTEYACEAIRFPVSIDIGCSEQSNSYKNVKEVVEKSHQEGYFTFNEMLSIAEYVLSQHGAISNAIQTRFPILFIDEAQDTSDTQWNLITNAFNNASLSIRQAFGDSNQAIFQSYSSQKSTYSFPSRTIMTIPNSHRFGASIARLADSLAISQKGMVGELESYTKNDNRHTIFLFDRQNPSAVLQAYADHILNCFTDEELQSDDRLGCYVIGMVHNSEPSSYDDTHFPVGIRDYWAEYDPFAAKAYAKSKYLIEFFRNGQNAFHRNNDFYGYLESISDGFRKIINEEHNGTIPSNGKAFTSLLRFLSSDAELRFRHEMLSLALLPLSCEEEWNTVVGQCKKILSMFFGVTTIKDGVLNWKNAEDSLKDTDSEITTPKRNMYVYVDKDTDRKVNVQFASIHSVKGRTHLATMVVETFWYDPNIKSIIPWLCNQPLKKIGQRNEMRIKCHYVALTRARGLICLALPKEYITVSQLDLLIKAGWNIVEI